VLECSAQAAQTFGRQGLSVLEIGDEALIETNDFTLEGRAMRNVRQMANRVRRLGYVASVPRLSDVVAIATTAGEDGHTRVRAMLQFVRGVGTAGHST